MSADAGQRFDEMSPPPLYEAIEDAIWQALDAEQAMPHSGVDPAYVVPEFLRLLAAAGYTVTAVSSTQKEQP